MRGLECHPCHWTIWRNAWYSPSITLLKIGWFCRLTGYPLMHISVQWVQCWVWRLFSVHAWYRHDGVRPKPFDHVVGTARLNAIYMYAGVAHVHLSTERRVLTVAIDMWSHFRPVSTELASATVFGGLATRSAPGAPCSAAVGSVAEGKCHSLQA
jgi:hypothetical protein